MKGDMNQRCLIKHKTARNLEDSSGTACFEHSTSTPSNQSYHANFDGTQLNSHPKQHPTANLYHQNGWATDQLLTPPNFGITGPPDNRETAFDGNCFSHYQQKTSFSSTPLIFNNSSSSTGAIEINQHPLPNGPHYNYPHNFSNLRFNGTRLLKPLNWVDKEIQQIIEDILDRDITVNAAMNRIYYITGDRPSKRILQQRVRRFREQRMRRQQNSLIFEEEENDADDEAKMNTCRKKQLSNKFSTVSSSPEEENKTGIIKNMIQGSSKSKLKRLKIGREEKHAKANSDKYLSSFVYGSNKTAIADSPISMVKVESVLTPNTSSVDEMLRNFHFSSPGKFDASMFQNFNLTESLGNLSTICDPFSRQFSNANKLGDGCGDVHGPFSSNIRAQAAPRSSTTNKMAAKSDGAFSSKTGNQVTWNSPTTNKLVENLNAFGEQTSSENTVQLTPLPAFTSELMANFDTLDGVASYSRTCNLVTPEPATTESHRSSANKWNINFGPVFSPLQSPQIAVSNEPASKFCAFNCSSETPSYLSDKYFADLLPNQSVRGPSSNFSFSKSTIQTDNFQSTLDSPYSTTFNFDLPCSSTSLPPLSRSLLETGNIQLTRDLPNPSSTYLTETFSSLNLSPSTPLHFRHDALLPFHELSMHESDKDKTTDETNNFGEIGFPVTAQKIDALIDSIDHDWIQKLLDETNDDIGDDENAPKILNPCIMKTLCINIENILNFMKQSICVLTDPKKSKEVTDPQKWKTFGEVLNDLLKLKDVYEIYENESTSIIMKRQSFVFDIMKWICDQRTVEEVFDASKVPQTNLNIKQFQRFIHFLKNFNSHMFDYATNYEVLYHNNLNNSNDLSAANVSRLSSVLADCVLIIVEVAQCVTVADGIGWNDNSFTLAAL